MKDIVSAHVRQMRRANELRSNDLAKLHALPKSNSTLQRLIDESISILRKEVLESGRQIQALRKQYGIK